MSNDYDVLIIGGGLVGGCLALALQPLSYRIAIVEAASDKERHSSPAGNRALALAYGSQQLLEQLGVWESARTTAVAIKTIHVSDQGHYGKARLSATNEGVEALGYVVTARALEDGISDALNARSVERICPARVIGVKAGSDTVCVSLKQDHEDIQLNSRLVVGADGGNSSVRKLLGIGLKTHDYQQTAIITTVKPDIDPNNTAFERFTAFGPLAMLPTEQGRCSVIWTKTNEEAQSIVALSDQAFIEELQQAFGFWLGTLHSCASHHALPLKLIQAEKIISERAVLIGNAVHQLHPVAGQGFNLGMRDVAQLAESLISANELGNDPGDPILLLNFSNKRKRDHERVIRFTDSLISVFTNEWRPMVLARNLGLMTLNGCPAGKHLFARYAMGSMGRKPRVSCAR